MARCCRQRQDLWDFGRFCHPQPTPRALLLRVALMYCGTPPCLSKLGRSQFAIDIAAATTTAIPGEVCTVNSGSASGVACSSEYVVSRRNVLRSEETVLSHQPSFLVRHTLFTTARPPRQHRSVHTQCWDSACWIARIKAASSDTSARSTLACRSR